MLDDDPVSSRVLVVGERLQEQVRITMSTRTITIEPIVRKVAGLLSEAFFQIRRKNFMARPVPAPALRPVRRGRLSQVHHAVGVRGRFRIVRDHHDRLPELAC